MTKTRRLTKAQQRFVDRVRRNLAAKGRSLIGLGVGRVIYSRGGKSVGVITAVGHGYCGLSGCTGRRLYVTWQDGRRTRPCTKGCTCDEGTKMWRIL